MRVGTRVLGRPLGLRPGPECVGSTVPKHGGGQCGALDTHCNSWSVCAASHSAEDLHLEISPALPDLGWRWRSTDHQRGVRATGGRKDPWMGKKRKKVSWEGATEHSKDLRWTSTEPPLNSGPGKEKTLNHLTVSPCCRRAQEQSRPDEGAFHRSPRVDTNTGAVAVG